MQKLKQSFLTIVIGLALAAGLSYAWTGPTANPPLNNAPAPINVSSSSQIKTGALQVNGFRNIGNSMFDGLSQFKSGTAKEASNSTWFPASDGKNYIRGKTIFADGAIGSGNQNLNDRLNNRVGIGTADPKAKLDIKTNDPLEKEWALRIKDGSGAVPNGYVLTSFTENNVDGLAGWAPLPEATRSIVWGDEVEPVYHESDWGPKTHVTRHYECPENSFFVTITERTRVDSDWWGILGGEGGGLKCRKLKIQ